MMGKPVKKVVIAGGGTAGWCVAAALGRFLGPLVDVTLVESEEIGIVGVGESTIPTVRTFHNFLGIDEREFLRATNATYKLAIVFENWARDGDRYIHSFGEMGVSNWLAPFHHVWLEARSRGLAGDFGDYGFEYQAAEQGKFQGGEGSRLSYAYHLDAVLYGRFLRTLSEKAGVKRIEGRIATVDQDAQSGFVTALNLDSGQRIEGDLFIDCTGFRALLTEGALKTGWEDWSHWLPTDRAVVTQTESQGPLMPYTRAIAHGEGWRWRIPLQTRTGNGYVYSSQYLSDDDARERFVAAIDSPPLFEPRLIRYQTGTRRLTWNKNVVALGLSSGFIEPLESTSIHLFQIGVTRLAQLFPFDGIDPVLVDRYNAMARHELERVRDFVILHYKATERDDTAFWRDRQAMSVPDTLAARIDLFRETAHAYQESGDLFRVDSWTQVLMGQRIMPKSWHRIAATMRDAQLAQALDALKGNIARTVAALPTQAQFIESYLPAPQPAL